MNQLQTNILEKAIKLRYDIETGFLLLGAYLHEIELNRLWEGTCSSFSEFVENDMKMSKGTVSKLIAVHLQYAGVSPEKLKAAGYTNLYAAIPLLKDGSPDEVAEKAASLSRRSIESIVSESKHGEHDCEPDLNVCLRPCQKCGKVMRV